MEAEQNPFMSVLAKLAQAPFRAAQLPFQLAGELVGSPAARGGRAAADLQRSLSQQVTGEEVPFSQGRQLANIFSLGLVPGNPGAQANPSAFTPEQQGRFDQLAPLQQRLLQARSPSDFAALIEDGSLFEERPAGSPTIVPEGAQALLPGGGVHENPKDFQPLGPTIVPDGSEVLLPGGGVHRNAKDFQAAGPTIVGKDAIAIDDLGNRLADNRAPIIIGKDAIAIDEFGNRLAGNRAPIIVGKDAIAINEFGNRIADNRAPISVSEGSALFDPVSGEAIFKNAKLPDPALVSESAQKLKNQNFTDESKLRSEFYSLSKIDRERSDKWRSLAGVFSLGDKSRLPADVMAGIEATIPSLKGKKSSGLRDVALIFSFLKILDPESTVREGEKDFVASARAWFGDVAEITIENALEGEILTDAQRAELLLSMRDTFSEQFKGYEASLMDTRKIAIKNGLDPVSAAPDSLSGVRMALLGMPNPPADEEVLLLLNEQLGGNPTAEELEAAVEAAGFSLMPAEG